MQIAYSAAIVLLQCARRKESFFLTSTVIVIGKTNHPLMECRTGKNVRVSLASVFALARVILSSTLIVPRDTSSDHKQ